MNKTKSYTISKNEDNLVISCPISEISLLRRELSTILADRLKEEALYLIENGSPITTTLSKKYHCSKTNIFKILKSHGYKRVPQIK